MYLDSGFIEYCNPFNIVDEINLRKWRLDAASGEGGFGKMLQLRVIVSRNIQSERKNIP
jgi:hypothetical protein